MEDVITLEQALASRFKEKRARESLSLEDVAEGARSLGFDWTRGKVFAIEKLAAAADSRGTRRLSVPEFLALPSIFERALRMRGATKTFSLHEFLPRDDEVTIGSYLVPRDALALILRDGSFNFDGHEDTRIHTDREQVLTMIAQREVPEYAQAIPRLADRMLERTVAAKLGVTPVIVAIASQKLWGHDLATHRAKTPLAPPAGSTADEARKWQNAARGHATREILQDEEFRAMVRSLEEHYTTALDTSIDPNQPGGAFDPRFPLERVAAPKEGR